MIWENTTLALDLVPKLTGNGAATLAEQFRGEPVAPQLASVRVLTALGSVPLTVVSGTYTGSDVAYEFAKRLKSVTTENGPVADGLFAGAHLRTASGLYRRNAEEVLLIPGKKSMCRLHENVLAWMGLLSELKCRNVKPTVRETPDLFRGGTHGSESFTPSQTIAVWYVPVLSAECTGGTRNFMITGAPASPRFRIAGPDARVIVE